MVLTVMRGFVLLLLYIWYASAQQGVSNNFNVKLTSERGGPPAGAQFVPIPVVDIPPFTGPRPMNKRPKVGQPPPPPPPLSSVKPTRRPKPQRPQPLPGSHIAPPPPAKPVPVDQSIPQGSTSSGDVPALPPNVTVVTPMTVVRPDQETVVTSIEQPTTTPRTRDYLPANFYRLVQSEDLGYYFDFEAPNTVARSEQGFFKRDALFENPVHVKTGTYSFTSPEGVAFKVNFVADERGYRTFTSQSS